MAAEVDGRLAGKILATHGLLFTTNPNDDVGPYVRNTSSWTADIVAKTTCICPSRTGSLLFGLGTAITKRHVLYHKHGTAIPNGDTMRFIAADNTIVLRTQDQSTPTTVPDFTIGLLSSDLPATIVPCPIAPDNFRSYLPDGASAPILRIDQEGKGLVLDSVRIESSLFLAQPPTSAQRLLFYEAAVTNDSGRGWFAIINDALVLVGVNRGFDDAQSVIGWNAVINAAIVTVDALGGANTGYTVSNPNLSEFPLI